MYVQANGRELPAQLGIHRDVLVPGLQRLVEAVHGAGGLMMAHINHAGRVANPSLVPPEDLVAASDVLCRSNSVNPHPLSQEGIDRIVSAFGAAAQRVRQIGFDAIEIPFSHGYLIHQFLSPQSNLRTDEYGGTIEHRMRFGMQILAAVRAEVGSNFPIIVRMNVKDFVEGGLEIEDALAVAHALDRSDVQGLSITSGTMCESPAFCLYPSGTPKANLLPLSKRIRDAISLPVIVAGRIRSPKIAREALELGQTDLIGLGRPFLADPDWVHKIEIGDEESILLCAACHQGCLAQLRNGQGTHCMFNPLTGRESEIEITPARHSLEMMVVGGGPAGLEAAIIASQRGHKVTLYEQEKHLGGQFALAAKAPHKEEFNQIIEQMTLMAQRSGVDIRLGTPVTKGMVLKESPAVIIIATGGNPLKIPFSGIELTRLLMAADILEGVEQVQTPTAFVVGGGLVGLETADYLVARGVQVTLVEMLPDVGTDMDVLAKAVLLGRLKRRGVALHTRTRVTEFTKKEAIAQQNGSAIRFPIETVVMAVGVRSNCDLIDALKNDDIEMYVIGDALKPRKALDAIWEGFDVALNLE
jgi:2,4-dienoyl-CoA reductase-like NADH-dependent reductase (Old Yellow Enzyme family)/thioredoxin reductase